MTAKKGASSKTKETETNRKYDGLINQGVGFMARFKRFTWDFIGVFFVAFGLITLISLYLPQLSEGTVVTFWRNVVRHAFGYGAILVVLGSILAGITVLRLRSHQPSLLGESLTATQPKVHWGRIIALELAGFSGLGLLSVHWWKAGRSS